MRRRRAGLGLAIAIGMSGPVAGGAPEAEACSCRQFSIRPHLGEEGVPRNVEIVLVGDDWLEDRVFELRRAGDGVAVEVEFELTTGAYDNVSHVVRGRPLEPLDAGTAYELYVVRGPSDEFQATAFTTGEELDEEPPEGGALRLEVQRRRRADSCGSSCWSVGRAGVDLFVIEHQPLSADAALAIIELGPQGEEPRTVLERLRPGAAPELLVVSSYHCDDPTMPEVEDGRTYCARVQLLDLAGNAAAPGELLCVPATSCAIYNCDLDETGTPPACLPLPDDAGPAASDGGPAGSAGDRGSGCAAAGGGGLPAAVWLAVLVLVLIRRRPGSCRRPA